MRCQRDNRWYCRSFPSVASRSWWQIQMHHKTFYSCIASWLFYCVKEVDYQQNTVMWLWRQCFALCVKAIQPFWCHGLIVEQNQVNSLGPSDAIWRQRSGSPLAHVMACCLTAPSHYPNQCWLITCEVEWHSYKESSQELPQPSITEIIWKIKFLNVIQICQGPMS